MTNQISSYATMWPRRGRSVIVRRIIHFAAKHPVGIRGVCEDERQQHQRAHEQKAQAGVRGGRLPQRERGRDDVRKDAQELTRITQLVLALRRQIWQMLGSAAEPSELRDRSQHDEYG